MQDAQANLFTRPDTFFGVCEGLGRDLRIHPNLLRVAFGGLLFWSPPVAIGAYVAAGAIVLLTRLLFPEPPAQEALQSHAADASAPTDCETLEVEQKAEPEPVALAA